MTPTNFPSRQETIGDYVAELQLHMTLQARNLTPSLSSVTPTTDRHQLVYESQALVEKIVSRHGQL